MELADFKTSKDDILGLYGKTQQNLQIDVDILREWMKKQPHLPSDLLQVDVSPRNVKHENMADSVTDVVLLSELKKLKKDELVELVVYQKLPSNYVSNEVLCEIRKKLITAFSSRENVFFDSNNDFEVSSAPDVLCAKQLCFQRKIELQYAKSKVSDLENLNSHLVDRISEQKQFILILQENNENALKKSTASSSSETVNQRVLLNQINLLIFKTRTRLSRHIQTKSGNTLSGTDVVTEIVPVAANNSVAFPLLQLDFSQYKNLDEFLVLHLLKNKFSVEKAKSKIESYCTLKGIKQMGYLFDDDMFVPSKEPQVYIPIPNLTDGFERIYIGKMIDQEKWDMRRDIANLLKFREICSRCDYNNGEILLCDLSRCSPMIISKLRVNIFNDALHFVSKAHSMRVKEVHVISKFGSTIFNWAKPFLPAKIASRVKIHESIEDLAKFLPRKNLPKDYGGELKSFDELADDLDRIFADHRQDFIGYFRTKAREELRQGGSDTDIMQGTFKKLDID